MKAYEMSVYNNIKMADIPNILLCCEFPGGFVFAFN